MTFLPIPSRDDLDAEAIAQGERHVDRHGGRITSAKAALLAHPPSFAAYTQWHVLRDELVPFIGERVVTLFAYAIADAFGALVGATTLRRQLVEAGEDVDDPQVTEAEQLLIDWGRLIARSPHDIPEDMYARLEETFQPRLRLALTAFAAQTIATGVFTTVGRIPLDEDLLAHRRPDDDRSS